MPNQPIILLTFANDEDAHLDMLKAESNAVYDALEDVENEDIVVIKREESASISIIADRLNKYQDDICIFHYSGHASGQHLELEGATANADGLAKLIAAAPNIQLVVLNGCSSYGQVALLLELGVKAVIATTTAIGDTKAKEFAEQFYSALGEYKTLGQAFQQAIAYLETKYDKFDKEAAQPKKGLKLKRIDEAEEKEALPWGLYENDDSVLQWKLNHNLKFKVRLQEGAKKYYKKTWINRYETLEIAEVIFPNFTSKLTIDTPHNTGFILEDFRQAALLKDEKHLSIIGGSGYGKTINLIKQWQVLLDNLAWNTSIPVYINLVAYNHTSNLEDFILNTIAQNYLETKRPTNEDINSVWEILKNPIQTTIYKPSIVLLLDGINDIVVEHHGLIQEIKNIVEEAAGTQIVLTTNMNFVYTWAKQFHIIHTEKLTEEQIIKYLNDLNTPVPPLTNVQLWDFIKTPFNLTLYSTSSNLQEQYQNDQELDFKADVHTYSELVWNSTEAIIAKISKELEAKNFPYIKFMIRHFLPYIGYFMEKRDKYVLTEKEISEAIVEASAYFYLPHFLKTFPLFIFSFRGFRLQANDWLEELERLDFQIQFMVKNLKILGTEKQEGQQIYYFSQSHYRDFFSAVHIYNDIQISLQQKKLPPSLSERQLSSYNSVGVQLGELCKEYKNTEAALAIKRTWNKAKPTVLNEVLELCRNHFKEEGVQNAVWNILNIWKKVRGHFSDTNLECLDLQNFLFDELPLRHYRRFPIHPAKLRKSLIHSQNFISQGHTKGINAVAYSPDGQKFLSASMDRTIKEWNTSTGKCIQTFIGHSDVVTCIQYSTDGKKAISGSNDNKIIEWDIETGKPEKIFEGHTNGISDIKYIPDEKQIISSSLDNTVKIWSLKNNSCIHTFDKFKASIIKIALHPNGNHFLFSTRENAFQEWSIDKGEATQWFVGHEMPVECVEYTNDGSKVISCSYDSTIKVWDAKTGDCTQTLKGHVGPIVGLKTSPTNTNEILSCGKDNTINGWDLSSGENIFSMHLTGVACLFIHPTGKRFIAGSWDNIIKEWDEKGNVVNVFEGHSNQVICMDYSKDGQYMVTGSSDNAIRQWDLESGVCLRTIEGHSENINSIALSDNGKFILSASDDHTIKLWLSTTGQCIRTFTGHKNAVKSICFHSNGRKFISTSADKTIREWSLISGKCLKTFTPEEGFDVANIAIYNPDASKVFTAHNDKKIRVWDAKSGNFLKVFGEESDHHTLMVYSLAFSPDHQFLISSSEDFSIKIWDVATEKCIKTLKEHKKPVHSICLNKAGDRIISTSRDKRIKEWDFHTGLCLQTFEGHFDAVTSAFYHPSQPFIYSASLDNTIKKWAITTNELGTPKEKIEAGASKIKEAKEDIESKKEAIKEKMATAKKEENFLDTFSKLTGLLKDNIKKVVIHTKDTSLQTFHSASGLYLQGVDFRNLHEESKFSEKAKSLLRQYGAIFDDKDKENWDNLTARLKIYKMDD
jgi:WD40 repeat protein